MDDCIPNSIPSSISPVTNTVPGCFAGHLLHLFDCLVKSVSVKFIPETQGSYNNTSTGSRDGYLVAKLVLLMLLTFTNTQCIYFMEGVNFILVALLLG